MYLLRILRLRYFLAQFPGRVTRLRGFSLRRQDPETLLQQACSAGREAALLDPAIDAAKIRAIFVQPSHARLGIGSLILKYCEEAAATAGFRRFEMGSTLTGVPLYTLKGYEQIERIEVPLPNGEVLPVIRMGKTARP